MDQCFQWFQDFSCLHVRDVFRTLLNMKDRD